MMKNFLLSQRLNSNQFHTGLNEIIRHLEANSQDEHLSSQLQEVEESRKMLFQAIQKELATEGIKQESLVLRDCLASATHFIDSCRFEPDEEVKASAKVLKKHLKKYGTFYRMDVHSRLTGVEAMLRDLSEPELQLHVDKIAGLAERIANVRTAMEALLNRLIAVEELRNEAKPLQSKVELKRMANAKLYQLMVRLEDLALLEPDVYSKSYNVVIDRSMNNNLDEFILWWFKNVYFCSKSSKHLSFLLDEKERKNQYQNHRSHRTPA